MAHEAELQNQRRRNEEAQRNLMIGNLRNIEIDRQMDGENRRNEDARIRAQQEGKFR